MTGLFRWYGRRYLLAVVFMLVFALVSVVSLNLGSYFAALFRLSDDGAMYVTLGCVVALLLGGGLAFERLQRWWLYDRKLGTRK